MSELRSISLLTLPVRNSSEASRIGDKLAQRWNKIHKKIRKWSTFKIRTGTSCWYVRLWLKTGIEFGYNCKKQETLFKVYCFFLTDLLLSSWRKAELWRQKALGRFPFILATLLGSLASQRTVRLCRYASFITVTICPGGFSQLKPVNCRVILWKSALLLQWYNWESLRSLIRYDKHI